MWKFSPLVSAQFLFLDYLQLILILAVEPAELVVGKVEQLGRFLLVAFTLFKGTPQVGELKLFACLFITGQIKLFIGNPGFRRLW